MAINTNEQSRKRKLRCKNLANTVFIFGTGTCRYVETDGDDN